MFVGRLLGDIHGAGRRVEEFSELKGLMEKYGLGSWLRLFERDMERWWDSMTGQPLLSATTRLFFHVDRVIWTYGAFFWRDDDLGWLVYPMIVPGEADFPETPRRVSAASPRD